MELFTSRKEKHPALFINKTVTLVGASFLDEIDEFYFEFKEDKDGFEFLS